MPKRLPKVKCQVGTVDRIKEVDVGVGIEVAVIPVQAKLSAWGEPFFHSCLEACSPFLAAFDGGHGLLVFCPGTDFTTKLVIECPFSCQGGAFCTYHVFLTEPQAQVFQQGGLHGLSQTEINILLLSLGDSNIYREQQTKTKDCQK